MAWITDPEVVDRIRKHRRERDSSRRSSRGPRPRGSHAEGAVPVDRRSLTRVVLRGARGSAPLDLREQHRIGQSQVGESAVDVVLEVREDATRPPIRT